VEQGCSPTTVDRISVRVSCAAGTVKSITYKNFCLVANVKLIVRARSEARDHVALTCIDISSGEWTGLKVVGASDDEAEEASRHAAMIRALPNLVPGGSTHLGSKTACGLFARTVRERFVVKFLHSASFYGRVITSLNSLEVFVTQKVAVETTLSLAYQAEQDIFVAMLRQKWSLEKRNRSVVRTWTVDSRNLTNFVVLYYYLSLYKLHINYSFGSSRGHVDVQITHVQEHESDPSC